jgi:hypothetical protein
MQVSILQKIFIWSLITEPFLFFIFTSSETTGLPLTLSRALQLVFLFGYFFNFLFNGKTLPLINPNSRYYFYLILYFTFTCSVSFISILLEPAIFSKRTLVELLITIYYFFYFLVLPIYILRTRKQFMYLFNWFYRTLYFVVAIGIIEYFIYFKLKYNLIPRHLLDSHWVDVGSRFHSILGEPRHAFVYLIFAIAFLVLKANISNKKISYLEISILVFCIVITQAFSGLVGLVCGSILLLLYSSFTFKNYLYISIFFIVILLFLFISYFYSIRINDYFSMIMSIPKVIEQVPLPYHLNAQAPEIIPLWLSFKRLIDFDLIQLFLGSGLSSASYAINDFLSTSIVANNPNAQISRLIFEMGIIGTHLYLMILIKPVKTFINYLDLKKGSTLWISAIFLFGAVLGVRSNLGIIYVGILLSFVINKVDK